MHIHKPKATHSLREFLSEIGVIVLGILIALSGEQMIEWLHWRHEVAEAQATLSEELAHDVGVYRFRLVQSDCISQRVEDLKRYRDSWRTSHPLKLAAPISGPFEYIYTRDAWTVAQASQSAAHMPIETRINYERIYNTLAFLEEQRVREGALWEDLTQFDGARHLDEHDLMRLTAMLNNAALQNLFYKFNGPYIEKRARMLNIHPEELKGNPAAIKRLCTPLIASS